MAPSGPWHPTSFHSHSHVPINPNPHHLASIAAFNYNPNPSFHAYTVKPPFVAHFGVLLPAPTHVQLPSETGYARDPVPPLPDRPRPATPPVSDRPVGWYRRHTERKDGGEHLGAGGFGHEECVGRHSHPRDCRCGCGGRGRVPGYWPSTGAYDTGSVPAVALPVGPSRVAPTHTLVPNQAYVYGVPPASTAARPPQPTTNPHPHPAPIRVSFPPNAPTTQPAPQPAPAPPVVVPPVVPGLAGVYGNGSPHVPGAYLGEHPAVTINLPPVQTPQAPPVTDGIAGRWEWMPSDHTTTTMDSAHVPYVPQSSPTMTTPTVPMPEPVFSPIYRPLAPPPPSPRTGHGSSSTSTSTPVEQFPSPPFASHGSAWRWHEFGPEGVSLRSSPRPEGDIPVIPPLGHHLRSDSPTDSWGTASSGMPWPASGSENGSETDGIRVVAAGESDTEEGQVRARERVVRAEKRLEKRMRELRRLERDGTATAEDLGMPERG